MTVKIQKAINFKNICNCIVDYKELEKFGFKYGTREKFEYDNNDTKIEKVFCFISFPPQYKTYVKCPECDKEIYLGTKIVNQEVIEWN